MDTSAYLKRQGWLGSGHSLHPFGHGIARPILVSKKTNGFGLGRKQNDSYADQWWARIFDSTLMRLQEGKDGAALESRSEKSRYEVPPSAGMTQDGAKWAGAGNLYDNFIRGEGLAGTLRSQSKEQTKSKPISCRKSKTQFDENFNDNSLPEKREKARKSGKPSGPVTHNVILKSHRSGRRRNQRKEILKHKMTRSKD